ncbi:protein-associating with the carboxyl-terminal domain of ezrin [Plodia interpunctella]|uniref:protein-associating with the carboxyl-terminal domain of ezrin n=1 Tax=Plodia interpunctella TaxID=58824 RepID=UPI002367B113|nr:protein-associating with the carboxyl-terminal domain of ezrin [Plodia interpunctella]
MMGNENSQLSGLEVEEKAVEITDFWSQYQATIKDSCRYFSLKGDGSVSVFKGQAALGPLWAVSTPLEKFSNNLLKYRHPCIVRYISAWQQRSTLHLATEYVQPLSQVLTAQTPLQKCIGLNNILRALVFLHEQGGMSHNNVSVSAIYVTGDGQWKLGGLQYLCPFTELTSAYLKHARIHRYDKAVDPNEDSCELNSKIDQYGFAVLVEDVYKNNKDDEVPHLREFKRYCQELLQHRDPAHRPNLPIVLQHNFFNHEFITIYKFLNFLPLKTEEEKCQFFSNILENLKCYDEETVAKQLGGLLLSRLTMLDQTARKNVIPYILKPKNDRSQNEKNTGFFRLEIFKEHVKPRLMQLFGVRDSQIRFLLLSHFSKFVHVFSHDELSQHILPELLLGIKDTDDNLVSATLICLSELVPILGASTVIGGQRSKFFTDGRPNSKTTSDKLYEKETFPAKIPLRDLPCSEDTFNLDGIEQPVYMETFIERPSPVGGESIDDEILESAANKANSEEDWSDWDNTNHKLVLVESEDVNGLIPNTEHEQIHLNGSSMNASNNPLTKISSARSSLLQKAALEAKKNIVDISELDIKNQKIDSRKKSNEDFDFFADMKPVIEKPTVVDVAQNDLIQNFTSKLNFVPESHEDENEGWGESWND